MENNTKFKNNHQGGEVLGLTSDEVKQRIDEGLVNIDDSIGSRSYSQIFKSNILTLFNFVNVVLAILVLLTGEYKNMLFMAVIIVNVCIGIVQEIRSKKTTDALSIVATPNSNVLRDGKICEVRIEELVKDDVIKIGRGDQIPADCVVVQSSCQVNESLLTGESDLITKEVGDMLYSGSFINSGSVLARIIHVGKENYASKITSAAKQHKDLNSEIMKSLNAIIKYVSIILFPVGLALFSRSFFIDSIEFNSSILSTVSALVGMIPEGLILLTSTVLAVAVIRLAKKNVLVQQLYCIETLARVDTLCLDKTGTITSGKMELSKIETIEGASKEEVNSALSSLVLGDDDKNETAQAIFDYFKDKENIKSMNIKKFIPFMSETKWSGATLENGCSYCMGATQFVLKDNPNKLSQISEKLDRLAIDSRVLVLAKVEKFAKKSEDDKEIYCLEGEVEPLAFICIQDEIRKSAAETIGFFKKQGVDIKVISGDDPKTVSGIAAKVGVLGAENHIDSQKLTSEEEIIDAMGKYSVFGRVKPEQKKQFVEALQKNHHTVAMTGDGVNDVMALKAADCSIAMAAGSDASRNISHLVLVDNDFAKMPEVVAEGRRSINNLQRSGSLFLVKTIMSLVLGLTFVFLPWQYPFSPIQMTLFSCLCIGFPSFVLALEPNHDIVRGHFLANCIVRSIPGGICGIAGILTVCAIGYLNLNLNSDEIATCCLITIAFLGVLLIVRISIPFTPIRTCLLILILLGLTIGICFIPSLFDITPITQNMAILCCVVCGVNLFIYNIFYNKLQSWQRKAIENEKHGEKDNLTRLFEKFF